MLSLSLPIWKTNINVSCLHKVLEHQNPFYSHNLTHQVQIFIINPLRNDETAWFSTVVLSLESEIPFVRSRSSASKQNAPPTLRRPIKVSGDFENVHPRIFMLKRKIRLLLQISVTFWQNPSEEDRIQFYNLISFNFKLV